MKGDEDKNLESRLAELIAQIARKEARAEVAKVLGEASHHDEYLTTTSAAIVAGVAPGTIRRWIREGKLVEHRAGRLVRVTRADLERLMRDGGRDRRDASPEELALRDFG